jgi:hypothetical protein
MILHRIEGKVKLITGAVLPYCVEVVRTPRLITAKSNFYHVMAHVELGLIKFRTLVVDDPLTALEEAEDWIQERKENRTNMFWSASERVHKDFVVREGYLLDSEQFIIGKDEIRFGAVAYQGDKRLKVVKSRALWDAGEQINDWIDTKQGRPVVDWLKR